MILVNIYSSEEEGRVIEELRTRKKLVETGESEDKQMASNVCDCIKSEGNVDDI